MNHYDELVDQANLLLSQETPSAADMQAVLIEIDDLINSPDFLQMVGEERARLQSLRRELKSKISYGEEEPTANSVENFSGGRAPLPNSNEAAISTGELQIHNTEAEGWMETAERMFYSGRFAEAIKNYERVLQIEPNWERARQHRSEAENYLRTGYIPSVALPAEAASAYGKAQSAARVGRYADAMALLSKAQTVLR